MNEGEPVRVNIVKSVLLLPARVRYHLNSLLLLLVYIKLYTILKSVVC